MPKIMSYEQYYNRRAIVDVLQDLRYGNPDADKRHLQGRLPESEVIQAAYAGYVNLAHGGDRVIGAIDFIRDVAGG